jgi:hypothetical protein
MHITHDEAWQIAGEIVDMLAREGIVVKHISGVDGVEQIAGAISSKSGKRWDKLGQQWEEEGIRSRITYVGGS